MWKKARQYYMSRWLLRLPGRSLNSVSNREIAPLAKTFPLPSLNNIYMAKKTMGIDNIDSLPVSAAVRKVINWTPRGIQLLPRRQLQSSF